MNGHFDNINSFIDALNQCSNCLILRNFEEMHSSQFLMDEHPDIDILASDSKNIVDYMGAISAHSKDKYGDGVHYYVYIDEKKVSLDIRQVGDGYYCKKWEIDMLKDCQCAGKINRLSDEHYFYSLIYHAIFQKRSFSNDYQSRLEKMAKKLGINADNYTTSDWITLLESFMKSNDYKYTYCTDKHVPLYNRWHDKNLCEMDYRLWLRHFIYDSKLCIIDKCIKIKHLMQNMWK